MVLLCFLRGRRFVLLDKPEALVRNKSEHTSVRVRNCAVNMRQRSCAFSRAADNVVLYARPLALLGVLRIHYFSIFLPGRVRLELVTRNTFFLSLQSSISFALLWLR